MILIKNIYRLIKIIKIIIKYNILEYFINKNHIFLKILNIFVKKKFQNPEKKLRFAFEILGPVFIKFGQILSVRSEFFSDIIIKELTKLQTNTKLIEFSKIEKILKKEFSLNYIKIFDKINENALNSASIAQIHTSKLKNGEKVVLKILKPDILNLIKCDINVLKIISILISFFFKKTSRLKLTDVIYEIEKSFNNETNFKNEALNLIKIKKNFTKNNNFYIPKIYLNLLKKNILILEYIDGIRIINKKKLKLHGVNFIFLSKKIMEIFYFQVFRDKFFHADWHPGNILISKNYLNIPVIILLDYGIVSKFKKNEVIYLIENIFAFIKKDYKKIVNLHLNAKTISNKNNVKTIENEIFSVFEPILNSEIQNISFKNTLFSILELGKKLDIKIQPQFLLFQKTILNIESICRILSPKINIWYETRLFFEKHFFQIILFDKIRHKINLILDINFKKKKIQNNKESKSLKYLFLFLIYLLNFALILVIYSSIFTN